VKRIFPLVGNEELRHVCAYLHAHGSTASCAFDESCGKPKVENKQKKTTRKEEDETDGLAGRGATREGGSEERAGCGE
jgi:hypothetical protein